MNEKEKFQQLAHEHLRLSIKILENYKRYPNIVKTLKTLEQLYPQTFNNRDLITCQMSAQ